MIAFLLFVFFGLVVLFVVASYYVLYVCLRIVFFVLRAIWRLLRGPVPVQSIHDSHESDLRLLQCSSAYDATGSNLAVVSSWTLPHAVAKALVTSHSPSQALRVIPDLEPGKQYSVTTEAVIAPTGNPCFGLVFLGEFAGAYHAVGYAPVLVFRDPGSGLELSASAEQFASIQPLL